MSFVEWLLDLPYSPSCLHPPEGEEGRQRWAPITQVVADELLKGLFLASRAMFFFIKGLINTAEDEMLRPTPRRLHEKTYNIAL